MRALVLAAVASVAAAGEWTWPEVSYKGKARSAEWCERHWRHFRSRVALVEGQGVDVERPVNAYLAVGQAGKVRGKVLRIVGEDEMVVGAWSGAAGGIFGTSLKLKPMHVKGVPTRGVVDGATWEGTLAAVGTWRDGGSTVVSCRPISLPCEPLTRDRFVELLGTGYELAVWKTDGKQRRRVPVE